VVGDGDGRNRQRGGVRDREPAFRPVYGLDCEPELGIGQRVRSGSRFAQPFAGNSASLDGDRAQ